ncbi:sugar transferase [Veillonella parvula]|uniref:sugar transferase n=1 Tax=Veillonella parvula TaxID=29466 RepID=UPI0028ECC1BE|nr:sugar transferase [Veillonella parvula]
MNSSICNNNNKKLFISKLIVLIADYIAIVLGTLAAYYLRLNLSILPVSSNFKVEEIYVYGVVPIVFLTILLLNNAYSVVTPYWDTMKNLFRSITIGVVVSIVLMYTGHVINDVSRLFVAFAYICMLVFIFSERFIVGKILSKAGYLTIPILLVGAGKTAELVQRSLDRMPITTYKIIGYVDDNPKSSSIAKEYSCLGAFKDVESVIKDTGVQTVLICAPGLESKRLVSLINQLQLLVKRVAFVPELFGLPTSNISARGMMEEQAVILRVQNNLARKSNRIIKRMFDIVVTICGGFFILPFMLFIAVIIYLDSEGPIIYKQKRIGQNGKEFNFYKFRSMVKNADTILEEYLNTYESEKIEWQKNFKLKNDPRVTKIGRIIRKTSIDELPQLWNVLIGDMSLVGPRPLLPNEVERYNSYIEDYKLVLPGLTGVWQVSGRSDTTFEQRAIMDSWYIHNWSIWIDIVYLLKTVLAVVKSKGAY